jgi:DNA-binding MarR family transcriptional regulator
MTENSRKVLETLKAHYGEEKQWLTAELAQAAGVTAPTVTGAVTGLVKKGFAIRTEGTTIVKTIKDGQEVESEKAVKFISLTEAGYNYNPDEPKDAE